MSISFVSIQPNGNKYEVVLKAFIPQNLEVLCQVIESHPDQKTADAAARRFIHMVPEKQYSYIPEEMTVVTLVPYGRGFKIAEVTSNNIVLERQEILSEEAAEETVRGIAHDKRLMALFPRSK